MHLSKSMRTSIVAGYWCAVALGAFALLYSMVVTLWGPRHPAVDATRAQRHTWCVGQLALLHAELRNETQASLIAPPRQVHIGAHELRRQRWLRRWAGHLEAVQTQCTGDMEVATALDQVAALARAYDATVVAWQHAEQQLAEPVQAAIHRLSDPWHGPTPQPGAEP